VSAPSTPDRPMPPGAPGAKTAAHPLSTDRRARFDAIRREYPAEMTPSLVLPLLHCVQDEQGYVGDGDAAAIAAYLGLPPMQVLEARTWYSMFERGPQGRYVIKVCRNIACSLRGSERVLAHLQAKLGIAPGETTADGRYTLRTVECLASCGTAPAMQIDRTYHENLDEAAVDRILGALP
jgi:NADH-quinone oxidoreductase subunit E